MEEPDSSYSCLLIASAGSWTARPGWSRQSTSTCAQGRVILIFLRAGCQGSDLFLHPVPRAGYGSPTRQHHVGVEVLADVSVTLHDGMEGSFVNAQDSMPRKEVWKTASGQQNRSLLMVMTCPSSSFSPGRSRRPRYFLLEVQGNVAQSFSLMSRMISARQWW